MSHISRTTYYFTFVALLILLAVTVGVSFLTLGAWTPIVAMTVAAAKTVLILLFFMHLRDEVPLVRIFAVAGFLWLALLMMILAGDYAARKQVTAPPERQVSSI